MTSTIIVAAMACLVAAYAAIITKKYREVCSARRLELVEANGALMRHQRSHQRAEQECTVARADLQRVRTRAKYFVDLLNVLSKEPFSRRKREAFFKTVRTSGLDAALVDYEQKYGNLHEAAMAKAERDTAIAIHRDMAEEVRGHYLEGNRKILEATKG